MTTNFQLSFVMAVAVNVAACSGADQPFQRHDPEFEAPLLEDIRQQQKDDEETAPEGLTYRCPQGLEFYCTA